VKLRAEDREILRLALPAFGALAAEPLYVLVDTAIVGHLGTRPLGGLGVAGTVLTAVFGIFNFLAYGTTAIVARRLGAGDRRAAAEHGVAGMWLAVGLGLALTTLGLALAQPIVSVMGASRDVSPYALSYLRISLIGAPFVLLALAGTGYLRGLQDTKTPLVIAIVANLFNLALELITITHRNVKRAQATARPDRGRLRAAAVIGAQLTVRTGALLLAVVVTTAIASRIGDVQLAAHQVAWQLWWFLALCLDAIAIAGQAIVGRSLGASDVPGTRAATRRMLQWGVVVGAIFAIALVVAEPVLALVFTHDHAVRHELTGLLIAVALMQPLGAVVFVLDGILIGAGDARYLAWAMVGATLCYLPCAFFVLATDAGIVALWGCVYVFMLARLYGMGRRYRGDAWLVTGAAT
jgi:Na+-driven multidrug efflux pump